MKKISLLILLISLSVSFNVQSQKVIAKPSEAKLNYESVPNDPLKARIYTLKNGLKVYLSVYKNEPRIQTLIAVKAGSKNDPADATGLAHYLEHMMFKGTDKFGTKDFQKEEVFLKQIEALYEVYRKTTDTEKRKKIYHEIDSVSGVAATYAIANEYDKMAAALGCKNTNAFTSVEQTVYINDVPSNQLQNLITLESERFQKIVLRLFHTELEAVYEEKNRGLDSDDNQAWEKLMAAVFQKHNYGQQTTIGTIDHLKNPSMTEINNYFQKYYVPNNVAICLSGDLDPDQTIKWIEAKFGNWQPKPVDEYKYEAEKPIEKPIAMEVFGPKAENMMMAFRCGGANSKDADLAMMLSYILSNSKAGLFDLNLNQSQKVLSSYSYFEKMKDYSVLLFGGEPKEGQKLEDLEKLFLEQLDKVKKGDFPDWLIGAIINDIKYSETKQNENNFSRGMKMASSFTFGQQWSYEVNQISRLEKITKQQIMDFAKQNFNSNYAIVYKRTGENKDVQKVEKPSITPVPVNREEQSPFLKALVNNKPSETSPVFLDFKKDINHFTCKSGLPASCLKNTENKTFDMYYVFDMGSNNDKLLPLAIDYLYYLGTSKYTPEQIQQEFYKLGASFSVNSGAEQSSVSMNGISESFDKALDLLDHLITDAKLNNEVLEQLKQDKLKSREDAKLEKNIILRSGMYNYGVYGPKNPFTNVMSDEELKNVKAEELINKIHELFAYPHHVLYYGTKSKEELMVSLDKSHKLPAAKKEIPQSVNFTEQSTGNTIYVVDYDMKQVEIIMLGKGETFSPELAPVVNLYNEYFGGSMSGIVFQELRESRALAYSVSSNYRSLGKKDKPYYSYSYIGSQSDKLAEALSGMNELLNEMPQSDISFNSAKDAIISKYRTERITKAGILFNFEQSKKLGIDYDIRKVIFEKVKDMQFADVKNFQSKNIKSLPSTILVLGKKDALDIKTLEKYGKVTYLSLKEIFGY